MPTYWAQYAHSFSRFAVGKRAHNFWLVRSYILDGALEAINFKLLDAVNDSANVLIWKIIYAKNVGRILPSKQE